MGTQLASPKGAQPPIFGPHLLRPNCCTNQDITRHGTRPRPRRLSVRWGPRYLLPKRGRSPQIFGSCLLRPNGWMDEAGTWHGGGPDGFVLNGDPAPSPKSGRSPLSNFRSISVVAKRLDASRFHLVGMKASAHGTLC